jgi:arginine utilization regulatory protein
MNSKIPNAEKILACLLENLEEGIQVVDSDGKTIYYNSSMEKVEGVELKEVLGKKVSEYLEDVKDDDSTIMNVLKTGEKIVGLIQHYGNGSKRKVTTINTTVPVTLDNKVIAVIEIAKDMTQLKELTESICKLQNPDKKLNRHYTFTDIYGDNHDMKIAIDKAKKASMSSSSVLLYAETGSGKEVFSQSIHYDGLRKDKPFIPINCASIPALLLEGMLFGTEKGGFTGAENKKGLFEVANHGTILLDEVNSLDPYLQSKFLRVLQEGYIRPVGSTKSIDVDVRIIATLNEEPEKLIESGKLRKDFYYRLCVMRINIPPLRERTEDIPIFVEKILDKYNRILGKNIRGIDEVMIKKLKQYNWPGNIRELTNVIEAAINMADNNSILTENYFDSRIVYENCSGVQDINTNKDGSFDLENYMSDIEKSLISKILKTNKYNVSKTARALNISRQNLQYKIKIHKIKIHKITEEY